MMSRRLIFTTSVLATAIVFFMLGAIHTRRRDAASRASYDAKLDAIRSEVRSELGKSTHADEAVATAGTSGRTPSKATSTASWLSSRSRWRTPTMRPCRSAIARSIATR